jgi:hypothetical protein
VRRRISRTTFSVAPAFAMGILLPCGEVSLISRPQVVHIWLNPNTVQNRLQCRRSELVRDWRPHRGPCPIGARNCNVYSALLRLPARLSRSDQSCHHHRSESCLVQQCGRRRQKRHSAAVDEQQGVYALLLAEPPASEPDRQIQLRAWGTHYCEAASTPIAHIRGEDCGCGPYTRFER